MPEQWRGPHRGPGRGPRPPWWPEDQPFPPEGGWAGSGFRRRFVRRALLGVLGVFLVMAVVAAVVGSFVARSSGGPPGHRGWFGFGFLIVVGSVVLVVASWRQIRRSIGPVGDVLEAVEQVADGDLGARVTPRGTRDDRRLARAFNEMAERLETDDARRSELLADLAHELRTPLAVIRGTLEGMLDGLYEPDEHRLRTVLDETQVMARLLEDLRTLSTAEAGALVLYREMVPPRALVDDVVASFRAAADERAITLRARCYEDLPEIEADPVRIGEVLSNLVENALRHTPAGGSVEVSCRLASTGEPARVELSVRDTGSGIPPGLLPHVFDRSVRSKDSGGSGLGLAIARSLVLAHGGEISAEAAEGEGTVIRIALPVGAEMAEG